MLLLDPPWQLATPIGDAQCHVFIPGGRDEPARYHCSIDATGEFWEFTQVEVRRNTNITEGRTGLTPFAPDVMARFAPMRQVADAMSARATSSTKSGPCSAGRV